MNKKTITHLSTVHPSYDVRIFHKECRSVQKNGFDVNLVIRHSHDETLNGVKIIALPSIKNRLLRMVFGPLVAFWKTLKTRPEIVHFHDPELIPLGFVFKLCGIKVIYDVHEDVPRQILNKNWLPLWVRIPLSFCIEKIEILAARSFDGIITATPYIKEIFQKKSKHCIDINNYPLLKESGKEKGVKESNTICYIGGITKERGIFEIVQAIEGTNIKLYLAGPFETEQLKEKVQSLKGWKNVTYLGVIDRKKCQEVLQKSMVGMLNLHPTLCYINSLPVKMFEYMNAGIPMVASDFPYWHQLLDPYTCAEFVDPLDYLSIRSKLLSMLDSPDLLKEMGKRGKHAVLDHYNWGNEEKKLTKFYTEILAK